MHDAKNRVLYQRNRVLGSRKTGVLRRRGRWSPLKVCFACLFPLLARCTLHYLPTCGRNTMVEVESKSTTYLSATGPCDIRMDAIPRG
jgi:hypothetical protein